MNKLITLILIILNTGVFAQNQIAKDILDKLSAKNKSYQNIVVDFDFILENKNQNIKEIQQGTLTLASEKFRLKIDNQIIINNGETQWVYLDNMNEVQIMDHDPEDKMMSPNKLFTIYEEGYKYAYIGAESKQGKRLQIIELFPKESREFIKVNLAVNAAKNEIDRITIHDKNGGTYTYLVTSFNINTTIEPFTFKISDYPNIEVIDLR